MTAGPGNLGHSYIKENSFLWSSDRLKTALSRVTQDYDQLIKPQLVPFPSSPTSLSVPPFTHMDVTLAGPPSTNFVHPSNTSFGLKVFVHFSLILYDGLVNGMIFYFYPFLNERYLSYTIFLFPTFVMEFYLDSSG